MGTASRTIRTNADLERQFIHCSPTLDLALASNMAKRVGFELFAAVLDNPPAGYEELWQAISEQQPVEMRYMGGSTPGTTRVVTPLGVMQMRGQIYLSSFCHQSSCDKTFRLDRIASYRKVVRGEAVRGS